MIAGVKGGSTAPTCSNPYRWLSIAASPSASQAVKHGGYAPVDIHCVPPALVRVASSPEYRGCGDPRPGSLVIATPRAFSTRVILQISLLASRVLPSVLDVPREDFHLRGFPLCSRTSPAYGSPGALRAGRSRVVKALGVLVGLRVHSLVAVRRTGSSDGKDVVAGKALLAPKFALCLVAYKKEAARSNGDTDGVFVMGTPMLKSVMSLVSKQRGRALPRKSYPYLNRWADPLFIGIPRGHGCSGDPVGLNSECPRRVDMLQVHMHHKSNRLAPRVPMICDGGHEGRLILIQAAGTVSA
ncbi:hypothetical protein TIFTF001_035778 [Ficus carica]|uniref:Uncharacterized protein n=1 Tax=Ficus carica TaxID=3494 RepID=A0AA88JA00_FICCA|nr:hypothetical protein TIFTF001_035778 [Ficus carica]